MVQIIGLTVGSNGRWLPKICSMTLVWTLDVPDAGAGCMFSIEDRIWDGQRCVYRKLKHGRSGDEVRQGWRVN
jgi:hypothetical protein